MTLDIKTENVVRLLKTSLLETSSPHIKRILVVGCGSGLEAYTLNKHFNAEVFGIDNGDHQHVFITDPNAQGGGGQHSLVK